MENTLRSFLSRCHEAGLLITDENRALRETGRLPDEAAQERKRHLIAGLTEGLAELKFAAAENTRHGLPRALMQQVQQEILKTLMLDREHEQLLLKCAVNAPRPPASRPSQSRLQQLYGRASR